MQEHAVQCKANRRENELFVIQLRVKIEKQAEPNK